MESLVTCSSLQLLPWALGLVKVVEVSEGHKIFKGMSPQSPFAWQNNKPNFSTLPSPKKRCQRWSLETI